MKTVTLWYCWDEDHKRWEFNHLEYGHVGKEQLKPIPKSKEQSSWVRKTWKKRHAFMSQTGEVIHLEN